jgi:hypothetical protein
MTAPLSIASLFDRGFKDAASLTPQERLVYLLADLETLKDMEGWDHFFTADYRMRYYRDLLAGLDAAGDSVSVEILRAYESHFVRYGVSFTADAIVTFLSDVPEDFWKSSRDWEAEFELAKEERWNKVEEYLRRHGYEIVA